MEHVIVRYPKRRVVNLRGEETGYTNRVFRVRSGTHTFNLGEPRDYRPKWRRVNVTGTTPVSPMEVTFEEL